MFVCVHAHVSTEFQIVLSSGVQMAPAVPIEYEKFGDNIQLVAPDISGHRHGEKGEPKSSTFRPYRRGGR